MSVVASSRTQRKDKSSGNAQKQTHATAEEIRLAQIISSNEHDEDIELRNSVDKIIEITGATEDSARTALYDANNDTNRAIELILENSVQQSSEWETAGRKKNKNAQTATRGADTFDDEFKDDTPPSSGNWEKSNSKGRGRGKTSRNRGGKSSEQDRRTDDDNRGGSESRERQRGGRRGRGRGGSGRGGRQPGRGPRRFGRYNQNRGEYGNNQSSDNQYDHTEGFGTFTNSNTTYTAESSQLWPGGEEDWGTLEVGTWSNDDAQKQADKKNEPTNDWGVESWNDDLLETKVFQSQNTLISPPISGSLPLQTNSIATSGATPQMGERIDLGALFKKNHGGALPESGSSYQQQIGTDGLIGQSGMVFNNSGSNQHSTPSVIQQLQQQGQSNSLFSDSKPVNDMESQSRLFGAYERQVSSSSANNSSAIGHYNSRTTESSFSQYNGKLVSDNSEGNSSSLLGSFAEQFNSSEQNTILGPMSELTKSAFTSIKPSENQADSATGSNYRNFSQAQQREATEAVKASLGLPPVNSDPADAAVTRSGPPGLHPQEPMGPNTLSFGAPQPAKMLNKQRKKTATAPSKIPASAVEMPGSGSSGYHESSKFDLQFGVDDSAPTSSAAEFNNQSGPVTGAGLATSQNSLFNNNAMSAPSSLMSHMTTGTMDDSSMFSSQMTNQTQQTRTVTDPSLQSNDATSTSAPLHTSQRYPDAMKSNEPLRGPPGISHPQGLSTATSSGAGLGALAGNTKQSTDLSSSGGSYGTGSNVGGGNIPMSGLFPESSGDQSQSMNTPVHSFYTSSSLGQQPQQHMDHSNPAGRGLRSPVSMSSLPGSIQASPMSHITGTPSKDITGSTSTCMSSLTSGLAQSHITPHAGGTPTKVTSASAPISILGSSSSGTSLGGGGGYGSMNMGYNSTSGPSMASQSSSTPVAESPGKRLSSGDLYSSTGLSSSLHHNHQQSSSAPSSTNSIGNALGGSVLPQASSSGMKTSSAASSVSKAGPPNLPLGVPPMLPNQYGIPMGPGLMTAYTPDAAALYGYTADPLMAVQSRVHQMPNYYDVYNANNPSANATSVNREPTTSSTTQGKFGRGEPSSPTSLIGMVNSASSGIAPQQHATPGQHNTQLKVSQTGTHQAQPFMNLPAAAPAAYPGYSGLYYNAFQYPPVFAAATAVPNAPKHQVNTTAAFQQPATGFANAYSTASINASSTSNLHDIQGQGYNKGHVQPYEKQQQAFHHHTNTPPPAFNLQTLTAAMAAANSGAGPGVNPYNQTQFMTMLPTHQHSQIHLHMPQHGDAGQTVGSQRSQASNPMGKTATKAPFGNTTAQYWGN